MTPEVRGYLDEIERLKVMEGVANASNTLACQQRDAANAEVKRLKEVIVTLTTDVQREPCLHCYHEIVPEDDRCNCAEVELRAEIERVRSRAAREIAQQMEDIREKDAEIERLSFAIDAWDKDDQYQKQLITELVDAWLRREYPYSEQGEETPLLKRAREAAKP